MSQPPHSFVSSSGSGNRYITGQDVWLSMSERVINDLATKLLPDLQSKELTFLGLLRDLGVSRHDIAISLDHGKTPQRDRSDWYGALRPWDHVSFERFLEGDPDEPWAAMAPNVFAAVDAMVEEIKNKGELHDSHYIYASIDGCWTGVLDTEDGSTLIQIRDPEIEIVPELIGRIKEQGTTRTLAKINLLTDDEGRNITIHYAYAYAEQRATDFAVAEKYLTEMLEIDERNFSKTEDYINEFLQRAGKFCHLMAHLLPFKLGTAGTTEWIIRAAAHSKGIDLGGFNKETGFSWDFKALLTPNRTAYAEWFAKNVFVAPTPTDGSRTFRYNKNRGVGLNNG